MTDMSRRLFLGTSGAAAAVAAGALAAPRLVGSTDTDPNGAFAMGELADGPAPDLAGIDDEHAVVVHIVDAKAGEVSVYFDDQHITFTDRALVARVMRSNV
jgi:hypothetical protein